jgi:hypothetical protein
MMMMLGPNKKKLVSTIVARISKPEPGPKHHKSESEYGESESEGEPMDEMAMGLESAAKGMIRAMESKDAKAMVIHLKDFLYLCQESQTEEPEEMRE